MDNPYAPPSADRPTGPERPRPAPPDAPADGHADHPDPTGPGSPAATRRGTPAPTGPGTGGRTPPRPEPTAAELEAIAGRARLHLALVVAALVTLGLALPWSWAATGFAVWAVVAGVRTLSAARRARVVGPVPFGVSLGLAVSMLIAVNGVATLALWPLPAELQTCQREALTVAAKAACLREYEDAVAERLPALGGLDLDGVELPGTLPGGPTPAGPGGG